MKLKYKYRLIVEESYSFGAIGKHGRGLSDYYDVPAVQIDIICASMANVLGSAGGFVVGTKEIVEHQARLNHYHLITETIWTSIHILCCTTSHVINVPIFLTLGLQCQPLKRSRSWKPNQLFLIHSSKIPTRSVNTS
jgi:serine palmitoyltransferase